MAFIQHPVVALINGGVVFLASLAAIVALVVALTPQPEPAPPVLASATALRAASIHVGQPGSNLVEIFGDPIKSEPVPGDQNWVQKTYVRQDVASTAVVDTSDQIILYSVMSCLPNANLKITTSSGTTVTLQGPNIANAESAPDADFDPNERQLYYLEGGTGSSLGQLIETSVDGVRSGNNWRSYLVGINRACGETGFGVDGDPGTFEYFGALSDAPETLQAFRKTTPANFYTEISDDSTVTDDTMVTWWSPNPGQGPAYASPYNNDLPDDFKSQYWAGK
ncbi:hypothetical protein [Cryobacterium sp. Hz9]|uniref:hypothetical protein n=1 Tax=Cryobacterium sp. Hz9 TaxID=1259167 RepID=UPI00106B1551|nr:hypothetical protein [Cryobacterium sp. Hz9]TFB65030.1 hypothetical protein E3N85_12645 [Cryobacterium sp. Hz9]